MKRHGEDVRVRVRVLVRVRAGGRVAGAAGASSPIARRDGIFARIARSDARSASVVDASEGNAIGALTCVAKLPSTCSNARTRPKRVVAAASSASASSSSSSLASRGRFFAASARSSQQPSSSRASSSPPPPPPPPSSLPYPASASIAPAARPRPPRAASRDARRDSLGADEAIALLVESQSDVRVPAASTRNIATGAMDGANAAADGDAYFTDWASSRLAAFDDPKKLEEALIAQGVPPDEARRLVDVASSDGPPPSANKSASPSASAPAPASDASEEEWRDPTVAAWECATSSDATPPADASKPLSAALIDALDALDW